MSNPVYAVAIDVTFLQSRGRPPRPQFSRSAAIVPLVQAGQVFALFSTQPADSNALSDAVADLGLQRIYVPHPADVTKSLEVLRVLSWELPAVTDRLPQLRVIKTQADFEAYLKGAKPETFEPTELAA